MAIINLPIKVWSGSAGTSYLYETQYIVNKPTAGLIPIKSQIFSLNFGGSASFWLNCEYSPINNLALGLAFGGTNLFGSENIKFQPYPGILAKYRFVNENKYVPAIAVGFNSQGLGVYNSKANEFEINSPGLFLAFSKSFKWKYGYLGLHLGTNYSFEPVASKRKINPYLGFEQSLGSRSSLDLEYDLQTPYNPNFVFNKGLLNVDLRYSIDNSTTLELKFIDIFNTNTQIYKLLKVEFIGYYF